MNALTLLGRLRAPSRLAERLAVASLTFGLGEGAFITGSAVFFTQIVGLTAAQVGLGLSLAGAAGFLAAIPAGRIADLVGPKRMWALSVASQASLFALWPVIESFGGFVAMAVGMAVIGAVGGTSYGSYAIDVLPPRERVRSRAYVYSALNVGLTLGSMLGGIALAFESNDVLHALPWLSSAAFVVNAVAVVRLPRASHDNKTAAERRVKIPGPGPLRNLGWMLTTFFGGVLSTNQVLLNVVIPLWLVEKTDAPRVLLAFLFGTNTVMCIFLPMLAARGVRDVSTALRAARVSTVFFVASCLITLATADTVGWRTMVLVWLGHVAVTGAELYFSAANWSFEAELMDPRRRGEYRGAAEVSGTLGKVWAPALYTFLALSWHTTGWLLIAVIVVVAAVGLHPAARRAERFLVRHGPEPDDPAWGRDDRPADEAAAQAGAEPPPPPSLLSDPPMSPAGEELTPPVPRD